MDLNYSKNFALYFDHLRFEKGITQEQFVEGIISVRQYRRYLNGLSYMSHDIITKFSERLGYRPQHMILEFEREKIQETKLINQYYNLVADRAFDEAYALKKNIKIDDIDDIYNRLYYRHATHHLDYHSGKIDADKLLKLTFELIDYPHILDRNSLSSVEMVILSSLISIPSFKDSEKVAERLISFADNPNNIYSGQSETMNVLVLFHIAEYYGKTKRYSDVISVCDRAISYSKTINSYYLLDYLYYMMSLSYYYLNNKDLHAENLYMCYVILRAIASPMRYKRLSHIIYRDWKIELHDFAMEYMKKYNPLKNEK